MDNQTTADAPKHYAEFTAPFAGRDYTFRLDYPRAVELEDACGTGLFAVMRWIELGTWKTDTVREIIRLGLIGGGLPPLDSLSLVKRYVDTRPISESVELALRIVSGFVFGEKGWKRDDLSTGWSDDELAKERAAFLAANPHVAHLFRRLDA